MLVLGSDQAGKTCFVKSVKVCKMWGWMLHHRNLCDVLCVVLLIGTEKELHLYHTVAVWGWGWGFRETEFPPLPFKIKCQDSL